MPAVMEDNEYPHEKSSRQDCQRRSQPPRHIDCGVHQVPQDAVRNESVEDLPDGTPDRGLLIPGDDFFPSCGVRLMFMFCHNGIMKHLSCSGIGYLKFHA